MRPADLCGWLSSPLSSRSLSTLRMVAADRARPYRADRVRLPTGSPVAINSVTTAYRTARARSLRSRVPTFTSDNADMWGTRGRGGSGMWKLSCDFLDSFCHALDDFNRFTFQLPGRHW